MHILSICSRRLESETLRTESYYTDSQILEHCGHSRWVLLPSSEPCKIRSWNSSPADCAKEGDLSLPLALGGNLTFWSAQKIIRLQSSGSLLEKNKDMILYSPKELFITWTRKLPSEKLWAPETESLAEHVDRQVMFCPLPAVRPHPFRVPTVVLMEHLWSMPFPVSHLH